MCFPRGRVKLCKERRKWEPFSASLVRIFAAGRVSCCWSNITSYHYNLVATTNIVVSSIIYRGCRVVVELWGVYRQADDTTEAGPASGCRRLSPWPVPDLVLSPILHLLPASLLSSKTSRHHHHILRVTVRSRLGDN